MIRYCVEHADNDLENAYFDTEDEAVAFALEIISHCPNEHIWVSRGEVINGDYSADELVVDFDREV